MKLDNIEVSGIEHVVIYQNVMFHRGSNGLWTREGKPNDVYSHEAMVNKIKSFTYSPSHRVWINGNYVNILPWDYNRRAHDE